MSEPDPFRNMSEWLRVMLDEIDRKDDEAARASEERQRRAAQTDETQDR